jgi:cyclic 2,3-diphosphoglycerate synthetase
MRVIAVIDGEHHPSVTSWGLETARAAGYEVVGVVFAGGREKLDPRSGLRFLGDLPALTGEAPACLGEALERFGAEAVLDLSDEPVLTPDRRMELVAVAVAAGASYLGPDFRVDPPVTEPPPALPSVAVIGTGKRVAKTALSAHLARLAAEAGVDPVVVAMGRGGPPDPVVAGPEDVTLPALLRRASRGEHAASDFLEDALTAEVRTVGARRVGGGLAGRPFATNAGRAVRVAEGLPGADLLVLEGSGASFPPVRWDAGVLVAPSSASLDGLRDRIGLLLSDLLVLMMVGGPNAEPKNLSVLETQARRLRADIRVAVAELQPVPLADVRGKDVLFATTAQRDLAGRLAARLERTSGCRVVSVSPHLADRAALEADLARAPRFDALLTELKAAAVDLAVPAALDRGAEVVFLAHRPVPVGGHDLDGLLREVVRLARARWEERVKGHVTP